MQHNVIQPNRRSVSLIWFVESYQIGMQRYATLHTSMPEQVIKAPGVYSCHDRILFGHGRILD